MSLQATETAAAAVAKAPRVSLDEIEAAIRTRYDITADHAVRGQNTYIDNALPYLSICILVMRNGFTVIGKSAPAAPENFNPELGSKLAYEDAVRQVWPLMGFALREKLAGF